MAETNVFRSMMLVGSVITLGIFITTFFTAPIIEADAEIKHSYKLVTGFDVGAQTTHPDHLTLYEGLMYSIEGKARGSVRHY